MISEEIKIMFFNTQGANNVKFNELQHDLELFHIIIIAETFNCNEQFRRSLPIFFASSIPRLSSITHNPGGIMIIARPDIIPRLTFLFSDHYSIIFKLDSTTITTLYLPPSLDDSSVSSILHKSLQFDSSIICGDINVNFGRLLGGNRPTNPRRRTIFNTFRRSNNFIIHQPSNGPAGVDHLLSSTHIICHYSYLQHRTIQSDHHFMDISLSLIQPTANSFSIPKFRLSLFDSNPSHCLELINLYNSYTPPSFPPFSPVDLTFKSTLHPLIDDLDFFLHQTVTLAAHHILGCYPPGPPRTSLHPNISSSSRFNTTIPNEALKAFKFAKKSIYHPTVSRFPLKSPIQDATDFYSALFTKHSNSPPLPTLPSFTDDIDVELASHFTPSEVYKFIKRYPSRKSGGIDGIHIRLLKALLPSKLCQHLSNLFIYCLQVGYTPQRWNVTLINPIPKKTGEYTIDKLRPISLTVMFRRIFEGLLLRAVHRIYPHITTFHPLQGGFRRHQDTIFHSLIAHESCIRFFNYHVFYDFKNAYDQVDPHILLSKLIQRNAPPFFIHVIHSLFTNTSSHISVNFHLSSPVPRFRGILQGSLLAPLLFNLFIDDLAYLIMPSNSFNLSMCPFPSIQLFADDIKCSASSFADLLSIHNIIITWSTSNLLPLNFAKCGLISPNPADTLLIESNPIPHVTSYKYLGFPITKFGIDFKTFSVSKSQKALSILNLIKSISSQWPLLIKLTIFKVFCRSTLDYGLSALWAYSTNFTDQSNSFWDPLEAVQFGFLTWIFPSHRPKHSCNINLSVLGLPTFKFRASIMAFQLLHRILNQSPSSPIRHLIDNLPSYPIPFTIHSQFTASILSRLRSHPLNNPSATAMSSAALRLRIKLAYQTHLQNPLNSNSASNLCSYISSTARLKSFLYDSSLKFPYIANDAMKWRRNVWHFGDGVRRICPNADSDRHTDDLWFRRSCPEKCCLLNTIDLQGFHNHFHALFISYLSNHSTSTLTFLDFLLNNKEYKLSRFLFSQLHILCPFLPYHFTASDFP